MNFFTKNESNSNKSINNNKSDNNNEKLVAQHTPKLNMLHVLMQPKVFVLTKL